MKATRQNEEIARTIINLLAKEKCTVKQSDEILHYVERTITMNATVHQVEEKLFNF